MSGRKVLVAIGLVAVLASMVFLSGPATASSVTPYQCDSVPKYYCSTVVFDWYSDHADNVDRYYEGQLSGDQGLIGWELYWMQDWQCNTYPSCTFLRNYGEQTWQTNSTWAWWHINANPYMTQEALVNMKLRFHEHYYDMSCLCQVDYYWCSPQLDHYLWNTTSAALGTGSC